MDSKIHTVLFDLAIPEKGMAPIAFSSGERLVKHVFIPVLERAIKDVIGQQDVVLDVLEFDLGELLISTSNTYKSGRFKLDHQRLYQQLSEQLKAQVSSTSVESSKMSSSISKLQTDWDIVEAFLMQGTVPWTATHERLQAALAGFPELVFESEFDWEQLFELFDQHPAAYFRFVGHFGQAFVGTVLKRIPLRIHLRILEQPSSLLLIQLPDFVWQELLEQVMESHIPEMDLRIWLNSELIKVSKEIQMKWVKHFVDPKQGISIDQLRVLESKSPQLEKDFFRVWVEEVSEERTSNGTSSKFGEITDVVLMNSLSTSGSLPAVDAYFISNSGLVLLAPFLPHFFRSAGLLDQTDQFKDVDSQRKALAYCSYWCYENQPSEEHLQTLDKLLCGWALEMPIPKAIELQPSEKSLADDFLNAIAEEWKALKTTDGNSIRSNFIHRQGRLSKDLVGWQLTVEAATIDILLNKLPWSIHIIKLPWINEVITVDWNV
ncbi:MAG: hypothetical protein KTR13_04600 [Saprospiraceae bacterium]|nr:hypothetical protein [Saprospiraceae bacterium]